MTSKLPWIIAGLAGVAVVGLLGTQRASGRVVHPEPRPGVTAERVLPPSAVPHTPGAADAYAAARGAPHMLDGVHCYCECAKHLGHRSLLTCFETDHGAMRHLHGRGGARGEARLSGRLARRGPPRDRPAVRLLVLPAAERLRPRLEGEPWQAGDPHQEPLRAAGERAAQVAAA